LILAGDMQIRLIQFVPDATIKVFAGADKIGEDGGSMIQLVRPLVKGETIYVIQSVGDCEGQTARVVGVQFVAPPLSYNPVRAWQRAGSDDWALPQSLPSGWGRRLDDPFRHYLDVSLDM
jgi:hypothetical protein